MSSVVSERSILLKNRHKGQSNYLESSIAMEKSLTKKYTGDDAVFVSRNSLAVYDGTSNGGVYSAQYALGLAKSYDFNQRSLGHGSVQQIIQDGFQQSRQNFIDTALYNNNTFNQRNFKGASTMVHAELDPQKSLLYINHLGDSKALVLRKTGKKETFKVVFRTEDQLNPVIDQTYLNCPFTVQFSGNGQLSQYASNCIQVQHGDLVLLMSDGVSDNLFESQIIEAIQHCKGKSGSFVKRVAKAIKNKAYRVSKITQGITPFFKFHEEAYQKLGYCPKTIWGCKNLYGGVADDISIIASLVNIIPKQ